MEEQKNQEAPDPRALDPIAFGDFLVSTRLLVARAVRIKVEKQSNVYGQVELKLPALRLYCSTPTCSGTPFFDAHDPTVGKFVDSYYGHHFIHYTCRNCRRSFKTFAVRLHFREFGEIAEATKIGEIPAFGEPRQNAIKDVLDDEIRFFERGYRAETSGLGIGAFAYYRRFVESHKDKIIAEIRKVAVAQGAKQDVLDTLDKAVKMNSFENAVKTVKDAIPDSLRHTGGHNPLTLLHDALSAGLHNEDDEQCLELAKDIRLLLTDLSERTTQALKNNSELSQAVNRLLKKATARMT